MLLQEKIRNELFRKGADFAYFVDISFLPENQNKGFPSAILLGKTLSPGFIQKVAEDADYVQNLIITKKFGEDEFYNTEKETDRLADSITDFILDKGFSAFSQSEKNLNFLGFYDGSTKETPLPHKTIALLTGMGWIGKQNLLVTNKYGMQFPCARCLLIHH